jgi:hypothetical protein
MSIRAIRSASDGRNTIARRHEDRITRRQLTEAVRTCAELQAANAILQRTLRIEQAENTRLTQEIATLRRALRLVEARLDPR